MALNRSISAVLHEHARLRPETPAFTFIDYEVDPAGYPEVLTWSQIAGRAQVVAAEVARCTSPGDRVALLAPQGLDYVAGFFGVLEAGCIVVPLPVPMLGRHDERVTGALTDCAPTAVLTTSPVVGDVTSCVNALPGRAPAIIEIDTLDLDGPADWEPGRIASHKIALLQYTSGSTGSPKGVMVSHRNVFANIDQVIADYFDGAVPADLTLVSWLPFYHDMGLLLGIVGAPLLNAHTVLMSPIAFLQKPARWAQQLATNPAAFTAAPNFAFELAVRRTSDDDMAGLDLAGVHTILSGSERIHAATIRRFTERFARFALPVNAVAPSYGLAEAMVYVASARRSQRPTTVRLNYETLVSGRAEPDAAGQELVSIGTPGACTVRIIDPDSHSERPAGEVGEIWVHGDNVADGYWHNQSATAQVFGAQVVSPAPDTPRDRWLRTGDLGVSYGGELFVIGRIKDLLIVDGRNHYPDDIEATVQEITGGRVAAIPVADGGGERLVVVAEIKKRGDSDDEAYRLRTMKHDATAAVSRTHGVRVADLMLVAPGSLPITTSGKIRRSSCVEHYRLGEFTPVVARDDDRQQPLPTPSAR